MRLVQVFWLLPRNLFIGFILVYRKFVSPLYGDVCRYHPSCSSYGLQQFQQRGLVMGIILTSWRILRCNPFTKGGVDEVRPGPGRFTIRPVGFVAPKGFIAKEGK